MDDLEPPPPDDFELGDLENESFLPNGQTARRNARRNHSRLTSWMPVRAREFVDNLSRIKIILLCSFIAILAFLQWINNRAVPIIIPAESLALSEELAKSFAGTAIPEYVLTYAPLVLLEKADKFFPSDLGLHIANTHAALNFIPVDVESLTLDNLDSLNEKGGEEVYLSSNENLGTTPKYLHGQAPSKETLQTAKAVSTVVIVVDKGNGIVDAFYMYFYTFNQGPSVYGHEIGNHLGDWEHNMIRFEDGTPTAIWYSQHEYGEAFAWGAVQKAAGRPICFSAKGSHANYAVRGKHDLHQISDEIPENVVFDYTSDGPLWDPALSAYYYTYSPDTEKFTPVPDETPVNYLYFNGRWGDQEFTDDMPEQSSFQGYHTWTGGPQGPWFKHLVREDVCLPHGIPCVIKSSI